MCENVSDLEVMTYMKNYRLVETRFADFSSSWYVCINCIPRLPICIVESASMWVCSLEKDAAMPLSHVTVSGRGCGLRVAVSVPRYTSSLCMVGVSACTCLCRTCRLACCTSSACAFWCCVVSVLRVLHTIVWELLSSLGNSIDSFVLFLRGVFVYLLVSELYLSVLPFALPVWEPCDPELFVLYEYRHSSDTQDWTALPLLFHLLSRCFSSMFFELSSHLYKWIFYSSPEYIYSFSSIIAYRFSSFISLMCGWVLYAGWKMEGREAIEKLCYIERRIVAWYHSIPITGITLKRI